MILQPDDLDGDPSIPKGRECALTAEQVAILERMFEEARRSRAASIDNETMEG